MAEPGDGFVDIPKEEDMAKIDISPPVAVLGLEESMLAHTALMHESRANAQSAHSIVRHAGARKFNQEDPIEAAAAEMILQPNE